MKFKIYGPFEVPTGTEEGSSKNRIGKKDATLFWEKVEDDHKGLSAACGCYVFALRAGGDKAKEKPWYVGKAEKQPLKKECFQSHKLTIYNDSIGQKGNRSSQPVMYFLARCRDKTGTFSKPSKNAYEDIQFVEEMFIGKGVLQNPKLKNIQNTNIPKKLSVEGFYGPQSRGKQPSHVVEFKKLFGE